MRLIRGIHDLKLFESGCVATIGNFDGVHKGHRFVLNHVVEKARLLNLPAVAIIFEPQPKEFFLNDEAPARLTNLREKFYSLKECGIDDVVCLAFNKRFASMSPHDFIDILLIHHLKIRCLVIGEDFRFGYRREGDYKTLQDAASKYDFELESCTDLVDEGGRISSSRIRDALNLGNFQLAESLLGQPYQMIGRVMHGDKRGREIGFPTANIRLGRKVSPIKGVYAVNVHGAAKDVIPGVANIGVRPTVDGTRWVFEVHLLGKALDLYGRLLKIEFLYKVRDEQRFASLESLRLQITNDVEKTRAFFAETEYDFTT